MQEQRAELERINGQLKEKILGRASEPGSHPTAISGFHLVRRVRVNELRVFYRPFIGLTVQGFKRTIVGKDEYSYGEYHCFVAGVDMPSESYITVASDEDPFLALSLDLDRSLVAQLALEIPPPARTEQGTGKSVAVMEADVKVMAAFLRLAELLDEPEEIPIMAPMLIREIHYRLLLGPQGAWLRTICGTGGYLAAGKLQGPAPGGRTGSESRDEFFQFLPQLQTDDDAQPVAISKGVALV